MIVPRKSTEFSMLRTRNKSIVLGLANVSGSAWRQRAWMTSVGAEDAGTTVADSPRCQRRRTPLQASFMGIAVDNA